MSGYQLIDSENSGGLRRDEEPPANPPRQTLADADDDFFQNPSRKKTLLRISQLSWPVILTYILELMPGFVNVIAIGNLGTEVELGAVSLAAMYCNVTGFTVGFGLASAMDTLCSQAFGANNKKGLGVILQRALLIELAICIPIAAVWIFAEPILLLLGQDSEVARLSGLYCQVMLPGLYPLFIYEVLKKFLQVQGIVLPQMWVAIVGNLWTMLANFAFVKTFDLGFVGAPLARMTTNMMLAIFLTLYVIIGKKYLGVWDGWKRDAFAKWGQFLTLGIPGMLMLCLEWWAFEFIAIFAGLLGVLELAAQSIIYNIVLLTFFIPYGISVAASVIIGNSLGRQFGETAKKTSHVTLWMAVGVEILAGIFLISLRKYIPMLFTSDQEVIDLVASVLPVAAAYQIFDGLAAVSGGILRGCGKQKIGAMYNFVGYFVFGLSSSAALAFLTDLGLMGLWVGVFIALFVVSIFAVTVVLRIDWQQEVELARERLVFNLGH